MEFTLQFDPSTLSDEQKNQLLTKLFEFANNYPNYLACSQPYSQGYKDGCYNAHDIICGIFSEYMVFQGFDPND